MLRSNLTLFVDPFVSDLLPPQLLKISQVCWLGQLTETCCL